MTPVLVSLVSCGGEGGGTLGLAMCEDADIVLGVAECREMDGMDDLVTEGAGALDVPSYLPDLV